jgi:glutathione synthase/RimK-type ligase-like ATP-grasp enzyme
MAKKRFVVVGEPESRRVQLFSEAVAVRGDNDMLVVSYLDLIAGATCLESVVRNGDVVRLESPGKNFELERELLRLGTGERFSSTAPPPAAKNATGTDTFAFPVNGELSDRQIDSLVFDRGLILPQRQWYRGWCSVLNLIAAQLSKSESHILMNAPDEIAVLFDKIRCHDLLSAAGVAVPQSFGTISNFDELLQIMASQNCRRVFLKPAHGSSASGIVAYENSGMKHRAVSTVEIVSCSGDKHRSLSLVESAQGGDLKLYNSRKVRTYANFQDIREVVNALCQHNLFVQKWYPKASIGNKVFDLRVLVVAGKSRHVVVRESKSPFTNLHLLNSRGQLSSVRKALGEDRFNAVLATCEKAAALFPKCLYVGVDVLIGSDFRGHAVAEVNAFGDLLPGIMCDGLSTYEAELQAVESSEPVGATNV